PLRAPYIARFDDLRKIRLLTRRKDRDPKTFVVPLVSEDKLCLGPLVEARTPGIGKRRACDRHQVNAKSRDGARHHASSKAGRKNMCGVPRPVKARRRYVDVPTGPKPRSHMGALPDSRFSVAGQLASFCRAFLNFRLSRARSWVQRMVTNERTRPVSEETPS